jgi:hypothetical protein
LGVSASRAGAIHDAIAFAEKQRVKIVILQARDVEAYKTGVKFAFGTFNNEFIRNLPIRRPRRSPLGCLTTKR